MEDDAVMPSSEPKARSEITWVTAVWMIAAVVLRPPLIQYFEQSGFVTQPLRHGSLGIAVVALAVGFVWLLRRRVGSLAVSTYGVVLGFLVFWAGGALVDRFGVLVGSVAGIVILSLSGWLVWRLADVVALHAAFFGLAIFMTLSPLPSLWSGSSPGAPSNPSSVTEFDFRAPEGRPDIFLVVVDAYPGIQILNERPGWDRSIVEGLTSRGFSVQPAWTSYSMTVLSLPALLDASHPVVPVDGVQPVEDLEDHLVGDGQATFLRFADAVGYRHTMVESTFGVFRCGPTVDTCVGAPFLDDLMYHTLEQSYLGIALDRLVGTSWIHSARTSASWLEENAGNLASNEVPDFVLAHVVLPHPPFLLDEDCDLDYRREYDEIAVDVMPGKGTAAKAQLRQIECTNRVITRIADSIPESAIVIVTSDHGSALNGQFASTPASWSDEAVRERMSVFHAMRAPEECHPSHPIFVQNLLRGVMRCLGMGEVDDLPPRMFLSNIARDERDRPLMVEVEGARLERILAEAP